MKAEELLRQLLREGNAKEIADALGISISLLYKWSETGENHRTNPLELAVRLCQVTHSRQAADWICAELGGTFMPNPESKPATGTTLLTETAQVQLSVGQLLVAVGEVEADGRITPPEALRLRRTWDVVKSVVEGFVQRCERGKFRGKLPACLLPLWPALETLAELGSACG